MMSYTTRTTTTSRILLVLLLNASLAAASWYTQIDSISGQSFSFSTGDESGAEMKVEIYDLCRTDSASRTYVGEFYPSSNVHGIDADDSSVVNDPGADNSISFSFTEGISDNTDIYVDNGDNTATVEFCAQVGLYWSGNTLINFAEVKLTYYVDLVTNFASLTGYTVTQAEAYVDQGTTAITFDGTLKAYFCNPYDYVEIPNDGAITHQGTTLHLCFSVPDGSYEVKDVDNLMVENAVNNNPQQQIITNSVIDTPTYAEKNCYDNSNDDTNVCVVSFLLTADFYDYNALTLTGTGQVLLEFGDSSGTRRRLLRSRLTIEPQQRSLEEDSTTVGKVTVRAKEMKVVKGYEPETDPTQTKQTSAAGISMPVAITVMVAMIALFCTAVIKLHSRHKELEEESERVKLAGPAASKNARKYLGAKSGGIPQESCSRLTVCSSDSLRDVGMLYQHPPPPSVATTDGEFRYSRRASC